MPKSIAKPKVGKPYRDFPLTPHPTGRWCKRINNKLYYFGYIKDGWRIMCESGWGTGRE